MVFGNIGELIDPVLINHHRLAEFTEFVADAFLQRC
jgi:hypothetical protein